VFAPPEYGVISIDQEFVDAIIPYSEPGEMGPTIWFEVIYSSGKHTHRHNGSFIGTVNFVEVPEEEREPSVG